MISVVSKMNVKVSQLKFKFIRWCEGTSLSFGIAYLLAGNRTLSVYSSEGITTLSLLSS